MAAVGSRDLARRPPGSGIELAAVARAVDVALVVQLRQYGAAEVRTDGAVADQPGGQVVAQPHELDEVVLVVALALWKGLHGVTGRQGIGPNRRSRLVAGRIDQDVTSG